MTQGDREREPAGESPVFLLCAGGRSGSTLVQRLIVSTGEVMVWGEHVGVIDAACRMLLGDLRAWIDRHAHGQAERFAAERHGTWIANINPGPQDYIEGWRAFLTRTFAVPARELGYPRWGFKEIRYGAQAAIDLQALFPASSFVLLVRHPADCLRSLRSTAWFDGDAARFLAEWARLAQELAEVAPHLARVTLLRYEDLLSDPQSCFAALGTATGIDPTRFDPAVLGLRLRGTPRPLAPLPATDLAALAHPQVRAAAARLGYRIDP